jgi:cytochrome o ubiquinol oxidase subunit II
MNSSAKRAIGIAAALLSLTGCGQVLDPAGPIGAGEKTILLNSLAIMLCIVIPTIGLTLWFAWWYRASNTRARYMPDWAYSGRIEAVVWVIPVLVILFLGGITWVGSHDLDPYKPIESPTKAEPLEVQVVSLDWKWLFIYPGQNMASVNRLVIPAGVPVRFRLTSSSVMNTFFVPKLGSMIYTMNGMEVKLHLQADKPGRFMGMSAHFSGDGFSDMNFPVDAVPAAQFAAWAGQAKAAPPLDGAAYAELSKQSEHDPAKLYGAVQPGLFDDIVTQKIAPAPGPHTGDGGHGKTVRPTTPASH